MKLTSFRRRDEGAATEHAALIDPAAGRMWPVASLTGGKADDMLSLIRQFETLRPALKPSGPGLPVGEVELLAPIPRPARNIFCVGKNYREHVKERPETGDAIPEAPIIFTKAPSCVIADGRPIELPNGLSRQIDYEAQLAVGAGFKPPRFLSTGDRVSIAIEGIGRLSNPVT